MEVFSALLAICDGETGHKKPVMRSFGVSFVVSLNKLLCIRVFVTVKWDSFSFDGTWLLSSKGSGGRLNKKDGLTRYGNSHVKDKTS